MNLVPLPPIFARAEDTKHIFSVDLEEYFQVNAFESVLNRAQWHSWPSRVEASTDVLLSLLSEHGATATFFCLGWIAERHPHLIRRIADAGHEIASHGWWHRRVTTLTPPDFERELRDSKAILEDITGTAILGFRAPSFSILRGMEWTFDVLIEAGYVYDSSLFPIQRRGYGYPTALTAPHLVNRSAGSLIELPPATLEVLGIRIPAAGGGYLRQFPLGVIQSAIRQHAERGHPAMFYIHPWELDPDQPRMPVATLTRVRHYRGLARTIQRLRTLLREFRFGSALNYMNARARVPSSLRGEGTQLRVRTPAVH